MDRLVIEGNHPLHGNVVVSGAKNAVLPCMTAAILTDDPCQLSRVPRVRDVATMGRLLETLGVHTSFPVDTDVCTLQAKDKPKSDADYHLVRQMRASICVLGPLVAKRRYARIALPGGCQIGHRPIDIHLRALTELGADVRTERGDVIVEAKTLTGRDISLAGPNGSTVTGTCNLLAAASLANGSTRLRSASREPEVVDFVRLLNQMGAHIEPNESVDGHFCWEVKGVGELKGFDHAVIGDRIEAATWASAVGTAGGDIAVRGFDPTYATTVSAWLETVGLTVDIEDDGWRVASKGALISQDIATAPFPGIPTDCQAQLTAVLTQAEGTGVVSDHVFPDRFGHISELARLGANVERIPAGAKIVGKAPLVGAEVMASDLRASAALIVAALAADGRTTIRRVYHLDRGYERIEEKLTAIGGRIRRETDDHLF